MIYQPEVIYMPWSIVALGAFFVFMFGFVSGIVFAGTRRNRA